MSRIQEEVTSYSWELMLRFLGLTGDVLSNAERAGEFVFGKAESATRGILTLLIEQAQKKARNKEQGSDENLKVLSAMENRAKNNKEVLRNVLVADEDAPELIRRLKESNVLFIARDIIDDNAKMIMYLSGDEYSVQKAVNALMADRGLVTEMNPEEFIETRLQDGVGTVNALDDVELEAFRTYAKGEMLPFAKITDKIDRNLVIYEPEKAPELKRALSATMFVLSGEKGLEVRKALNAKISERKKLYSALDDGKEHVIISAKNPDNYILLDGKEAVLYKNNQKVQNVSRENKEFLEKALQMSDGLEEAVVFNKGEYALTGTEENLRVVYHKSVLEDRTRERIPEQRLHDMFEEANERRRLIEEKMAIDDENQNPFWVFDESYSYSSAASHEQLDDDDKEKHEEQEIVDQVTRKLKALSLEEMSAPAPRGIDAIIARAEQRKTEKIRAEKEKEKKENLKDVPIDL